MQITKPWLLIREALKKQKAAILLLVLDSKGSSPGRSGFMAAVDQDGNMAGSIGGGIMEHKWIETARAFLKEGRETFSIRKQYHSKEPGLDQSGAICSGEQTILLYPVHQRDLEIINSICKNLKNQHRGILRLDHTGIKFSPISDQQQTAGLNLRSADDWSWEGILGLYPEIHIIGGGHCSLALSKLMADLNFLVTVYENRAELNTFADNPYAHRKISVGSYAELRYLIPSDEGAYVAIMTFGYRTDEEVLNALKGHQYYYLGLLGSRSKNLQLLEKLQSEGMEPAWLDGIHSTMGLDIKSQTPMEIAVSIAAEIIQEKNRHKV